MAKLRDYVIACRPAQWVKNGLVFAGLIFAVKFTNPTLVARAIVAFIAFSFLSSAVYLYNDIQDREFDRAHPKKKNRPIAAGRIPIWSAYLLSFVLAVLSLSVCFYINNPLGIIALSYMIMNILYSQFLKQIVILDVMIIAIGFVLRAVAGAYAVNVSISPWLLINTILLALFLGFGKRRYEVVLLDANKTNHRKILDQYSLPFLDQMISVTTASSVVIYAMYTMSIDAKFAAKNMHLELTIPFVVYGIFRYLYIVYHKAEGGSPTEALVADRPILVNIILWLAAVILIFMLS
ncbi:MAG: decaprenyl-phosphate phosphoribosyltransferase [candidate division Zixibacteria bacterium]|nr:decaprenyl-phosphate phosphoribosyltransferase [candidate division Zixibacteria bacterium]